MGGWRREDFGHLTDEDASSFLSFFLSLALVYLRSHNLCETIFFIGFVYPYCMPHLSK